VFEQAAPPVVFDFSVTESFCRACRAANEWVARTRRRQRRIVHFTPRCAGKQLAVALTGFAFLVVAKPGLASLRPGLLHVAPLGL